MKKVFLKKFEVMTGMVLSAVDNNSKDQTAWMCRLIGTIAV